MWDVICSFHLETDATLSVCMSSSWVFSRKSILKKEKSFNAHYHIQNGSEQPSAEKQEKFSFNLCKCTEQQNDYILETREKQHNNSNDNKKWTKQISYAI